MYAIEAAPKTFELLSFNITHSEYSNITPIQIALGEANGKFLFAEHSNEAGRSSLVDPEIKMSDQLRAHARKIFEVDVETGDSVLSHRSMPPVSLIKIDVEGFERSVIKGLKSTIEQFHPIILIEQLANEFHAGTSETIKILRELGYDEFYSPESASKVRNRRVRILSKLLWGDTIDLQATDSFLPRHYPMIVCCSSSSPFSLKKNV